MAESSSESDPLETAAGAAKWKQFEAELARMTKVYLDAADPIVIRDMEGNVVDINHETERVFGWSRGEFLNRGIKHLLTPEFHPAADDMYSRVQRGELVRNVEGAVRSKSGDIVPVLVTAFLLTDEHDRPLGYAQIVKDITRLKEATEQLAERNRELQQFANTISHDLGAPLRSIRLSADLLRKECGDGINEESREHLAFISEGIDRLDRMVEELVDYAQIELREFVFQETDCGRALAEALANLQAAITENSAVVTWDALPTLQANRTWIVQLFQNLIGNAIKFRRFEPPRIHVSVTAEEGGWRFTIRDNGIGIDASDLESIFGLFRRLHADNLFPGTGFGLAICKAIVARHGGKIWVESEKGAGSTFHFTLPQPRDG
ncbi:MAG: PAS domain S-box protein [Planctomycetes bacterium]|nr:PAS domain S-box protein [Planctomycetota bacterium]